LLLGIDGAGKTTLLNEIKYSAGLKVNRTVTPTIGLNLASIDMCIDVSVIIESIKLIYWDLGG
jgi:GTPase SAR1 family protein